MAFTMYGRGQDPTAEILKEYHVSDMDSAGNPTEQNPHYFGYVNKDCEWYIMKVGNQTTRYARGAADYEANWANRESLAYHNFQNIF